MIRSCDEVDEAPADGVEDGVDDGVDDALDDGLDVAMDDGIEDLPELEKISAVLKLGEEEGME